MYLKFLIDSAIQQLAFIIITLEFVKCLSFDNKLNVVRSDCYERLAIGQKLHSRDIDKTLNLSTVQDCRLACTKEDINCRTFSFGIGLKGNSTCELSKHVVKESQNLTPIGTVASLDFDLYIKKLGCKLVLTQETHQVHLKPYESNITISDRFNIPIVSTKIGNDKSTTPKPTIENNHQQNVEKDPQTTDSNQPIKVQSSLISVASGPGPLVHIVSPIFENSDRNRPFSYGTGKPYYPNRYNPNYDNINRPGYDRDSYNYYSRPSPNRNKFESQTPAYLYDRFDGDNVHFNKKKPGYESPQVAVNYNEYEDSHYYNYDKPHRPQTIPDRPYSNDPYNKPNRIPERPESNYYDYQQYPPNNVPQKPLENDYMYGNKPKPPQQTYANKKPETNLEVTKGNNSNTYQQNLNKPTEIPKPPNNSYDDQTNSDRPNNIPIAPTNNFDNNYNQNLKPTNPNKIPERPVYENDGYLKPHRPSYNRPTYDSVQYDTVFEQNKRNESYIIYRPIRPQEIPVEDKPYRPSKLPDIFSSYDQMNSPFKPQVIPARPVQHNSYGPELNQPSSRPTKIPSSPSNDNVPAVSDQRPYEHPQRPYEYPQRPYEYPQRPYDYSQRPYDYPQRPYDYPQRPYDYPERPYDYPERPSDYPQRPYEYPQRPYDVPTRPNLPSRPLETNYGSRPHRPVNIPDIPFNNVDGYEQTVNSQRPYDIPSRPQKRPTEANNYGPESHLNRPTKIPDSPLSIFDNNYGATEKPQRPYDIPNKPQKQPNRPLETNSYGSELPLDSNRPNKIPETPVSTFDRYGQPQKPYDIPNRPQKQPSRPQKQPSRPAEPSNYGSDSQRPTKIPDLPVSAYDSYGHPQRPYNKPTRRPPLPSRPIEEHNSYGSGVTSKPNRPTKIPNSPSNNYGDAGQTPYDVPNSNLDDLYFTVHNRRYQSNFYEDRYKYPVDNGNRYEYNSAYPDRHDEISKHPARNPNTDSQKTPFERPVKDINRNEYIYSSIDKTDFDYYNRRRYPQEDSDYNYYRYEYRPHQFDYNQRYNDFLPWNYKFDQDKSYYGFRDPYRDDYNDPYYKRVVHSTDFKRPVYVPLPSDNQTKPNVNNNTMDTFNNTQNVTVLNVTTNSSDLNTTNSITFNPKPEENELKNHIRKPIVSERIGSHGETITSIITEISDQSDSCFRRVLAGKRVIRELVRRAVLCERVEDCQRECSEEKRFVCEGFNYRLDPSGRAQGECELLDLPLSRIDVRRDVYSHSEYDYYERDRNSDAPDCTGYRNYGINRDGDHSVDNRYDYYDDHKRRDYYDDFDRDGNIYDYEYRQQPRPVVYYDRYDSYDGGSRRGDYNYQNGDEYGNNYQKVSFDKTRYKDEYYGHHYNKHGSLDDDHYYKSIYPDRPYDYKSYEPYLPRGYWKSERPYHDSSKQWDQYFHDRVSDKNHWGFSKEHGSWGNYGGAYGNFGAPDSYYHYDYYNHKNNNRPDYNINEKKYFFVPDNYGGSKDWGHYGGTYGYEDRNKNKESYDYWGFNNIASGHGIHGNNIIPPQHEKPYTPSYDNNINSYGTYEHNYQEVLKDDCSLRMVTGFKLHKGIIKKLTSVASIYECELLCYKERDFVCNSYAFRYTSIPSSSPENCYLSDRDYKELDYYTDLEPDRDCDVYRMHNQQRCDQPDNPNRDSSECFWRVRTSQRLDHAVVRDSLNVRSIVECQLQCLRSPSFTCRAFSFRYGPPIPGGAIDNCQLTDRSFLDLNPILHVTPENGFELYERGSYGHGCEPNHFQIGHKPEEPPGDKINQLCYVGYSTPARLLSQATKKSVKVNSEEECQEECTRTRKNSLFQCMSLSYRTAALNEVTNCDLSDIVQRDLLSNVDYVEESNSWLFAWDIHNPRCAVYSIIGIGSIGGHNHGIGSLGGHNHGIGDHHHGIGDYDHGIGSNGDHNGIGSDEDYGNHGKEIIPWIDPNDSYNTWRIYSVGGLPCKRGSLCTENKVAGFWYCELEGREEHAWDYCCRPDHQCGYSEGFDYQWCYVGPERTQWRKCNDHYYPYINTYNHAESSRPVYPHNQAAWASTNSINTVHAPHSHHLNRPPNHPQQPTLIDYETQLNDQYLDPPVPGGFGPSRHWPISYLHKEAPPNDTLRDSKVNYRSTTNSNSNSGTNNKANMIEATKSHDLKSFLTNSPNKSDETLYLRIPLPLDNDKVQKTRSAENNKNLNSEQNQSNFNKNTGIRSETAISNTNVNQDDKNSQTSMRSSVTRMDKTLSNQQQRRSRITKGIVEAVPSP